MKLGDKTTCPACGGEYLTYVIENAQVEVKGEALSLDMHVLSCPDCKNSFEEGHMSNRNLLIMDEAYFAVTAKHLASEDLIERVKIEIAQHEQDERTG